MVKKISLILISLFLTTACASKELPKENDAPILEIDEAKEVKHLATFSAKPASELLGNSIELPSSNDLNFTPTVLNDLGLLVGEMSSKEDPARKYVGYQNVETAEFTIIKEFNIYSLYSTAIILGASNDYICFTEVQSGTENTSNIYLYSIKNDDYKLIYEEDKKSSYIPMNVEILENDLYVGKPVDDDYKIFHYDIKAESWDLFSNERSNYPIALDEKLYYISYDQEKELTSLYSTDLNSKEKTLILSRTKEEGWIQYIESDDENIYIFLNKQNSIICYIYNLKNNTTIPYFKDTSINSPTIHEGFITWWGNSRSPDRVKSQYYLLDINSNTNYLYDDSLIFSSKKGIVWIKFNIDENQIPKNEIFIDNNSTVMFCEKQNLVY